MITGGQPDPSVCPLLLLGGAMKKRGERVDIRISGLDEKGQGVGMLEGYTARVRGALPGDHVRAVVGKIRRRNQQLEARKEEVLSVEIQRTPARCVHFGICGGCGSWRRQAGLEEVL